MSDLLNRFRGSALLVMIVLVLGSVPGRAGAEEPTSPSPSPTPDTPSSESPAPTPAPQQIDESTEHRTDHGSPTLDPTEGTFASGAMAGIEPSTGASQTSIGFQLPRARGRAQPALSLSYSSSSARNTELGYAWSLNLPRIERHNLSGGPTYYDDRFELGGDPIVLICDHITPARCAGKLQPGEQLPEGMGGWHYYRPQLERNFNRIFLSSDGATWRVFTKGGVVLEFGVPRDNPNDSGAVDRDTALPSSPIFRWNLVRQWEVGRPANVVVYKWTRQHLEGGEIRPTDDLGYLTDILDTPPPSGGPTSEIPASAFAHHTRLVYEPTQDMHEFLHMPRIWRRNPLWRLTRVDITSANFKATIPRQMVRRYELSYYARGSHIGQIRWLLEKVQMSGACAAAESGSDFALPANLNCAEPPRPIAQMAYSGHGSFRHKRHPTSIYAGNNFLFVDVDRNGLPDLLQPAGTTLAQTLYHNMAGQFDPEFGSAMIVNPVLGADSQNLLFRRGYLGDWDGSGRVNLLWYKSLADPRYVSYSAAAPPNPGQPARWVPSAERGPLNPEWAQMAGWPTTLVDVDGDGYMDSISFNGVAFATANTFLTTREPHGQIIPFSRKMAPSTLNQPPNIRTRFQPQQFVVDMSGDNIPDIVMAYHDSIQLKEHWIVWYGLGDGQFTDYVEFGQARPPEDFVTGVKTYLHDINGDSRADKIRFVNVPGGPLNHVGIQLNDGKEFRLDFGPGLTIPTPDLHETATLDFADLNASGIDDVVLRQPSEKMEYFDLLEDQRPALLETISNGYGATTVLTYKSTPQLEADAAQGLPWMSSLSSPTHVVTKVEVRSNARWQPASTSYTYRNPVYNAYERRFLGFRTVESRIDDDQPLVTRTRYLIGYCLEGPGRPPCVTSADDPLRALRGAPVMIERFSGGSQEKHISTAHQQYKLVKLYDGMDGRKVRALFPTQTNTWLYDTGNFVRQPENIEIADLVSSEISVYSPPVVLATAAAGRAHVRSSVELDVFGNVVSQTDEGTVDGGPGIATDSPISSITEWHVPVGDPSGWQWRPKDSYAREAPNGPNLRHWRSEYNAAGDLVKSFGDLTGTLPLVRFHEDFWKDVAPTPLDASQDRANILLAEIIYDAFGNVQRAKNATGSRCTDVVYDPEFGQLPIGQTIYTHGCGGAGLTSRMVFDRGLGVPTVDIAPNGAMSATTYDAFGRPTEVFRPNPDLPGITEATPSVKFTYMDRQGGPYQTVMMQERDDDGSLHPQYNTSWSYVDALGTPVSIIHEADVSAGDAEPYIVSGEVERNARGQVTRAFESHFAAVDPTSPTPPPLPSSGVASRRVTYDAFGRPVDTFGLEGERTGNTLYHALSVDSVDAADLAQGANWRPLTTVHDGHGRTTSRRVPTDHNRSTDTLITSMTYLPTGEMRTLTRSHALSSDTYTRSMTYDSFGRLVQNTEPNTSTGFGSADVKAWRYAYNDDDEVVGTSDARGCGKNVQWDGAGRVLAEVFSPCLANHPDYEERPAARFIYDAPEQGQTGNFWAGSLAAVYDRGQHTQYSYDGQGRTTSIARQVAIPNEDQDPLTEYAPHWFRQTFHYDTAGRVIAQSTGADVEELLGQPVTVGSLTGRDLVTTSYTGRGIAHRVSGSYGDLITRKVADADGFVRMLEYGDLAKTTAIYTPDARRRLLRAQLSRIMPSIWSSPPAGYTSPIVEPSVQQLSTTQTVLQDLRFDSYDPVNNPLLVNDARIPAEWPAGAKPVTKRFTYDDLEQLRRVDYATGEDIQVSPFAAERAASDKAPVPEGPLVKRVKWQTSDFDWQGNLHATDDDAHAFFDRSMGLATHGTATNGPNRLVSAVLGDGRVDAVYDATGNVSRMLVKKKNPAGESINLLFVYEWDEIGQLTRARRLSKEEIPLIDVLGTRVLTMDLSSVRDGGVDLRYTYNAGGQRVMKSATNRRNFERTYSIEVFSSLRLNDARYVWEEDAYERTAETETAYLVSNGSAIARVVHGDATLPTIDGNRQHVYFTMTDPLGSTSVVVDKATSELVERSTYLAFGQAETDYRPERWKSFREDYRFTGKEDDIGVGLTYFGARYYVAPLGQWASPDPLTIHELGSDLNPYAYVFGSPQRYLDPTGLSANSGGTCNESQYSCGAPGGNQGWIGFLSAGATHARGGAAGGAGTRFWDPGAPGEMPGDEHIPNFVDARTGKASFAVRLAQHGSAEAEAEAEVTVRAPPRTIRSFACAPSSPCGVVRRLLRDRWDTAKERGPREFAEGAADKLDTLYKVALVIAEILSRGRITPPPGGTGLVPVPVGPGAGAGAGPAVVPLVPPAIFAGKGGDGNRTSANQMNNQVRRGQAPRSVDRVDKGLGPFEKDHAHFGPGEGSPALNFDGTWKHKPIALGRDIQDWLLRNGWKIPD